MHWMQRQTVWTASKHHSVRKMPLNTAQTSIGVFLHSGETILLYSSQVIIEFSGQMDEQF